MNDSEFKKRMRSKKTWDRAKWFWGPKDMKEVRKDTSPMTQDLLPCFLGFLRWGIPMFLGLLPLLLCFIFSKFVPGWLKIVSVCLSLRAVLRLFDNAASSFFETLDVFHIEVHERRLFDRVRRQDRKRLEEKFQEILYLFASSAMTLVDQSRSLSTKVQLPGYTEKVAATFANNPRHKFIQELRNDLIHVKLHEPSWSLRMERDNTRITRFVLFPNELQRSSEWHRLAKEYLQQHPDGVDLGALIREYHAEIVEMQNWLQNTLNEVAGETIGDFIRCNNFVLAVADRCWWRLILSQVVIQQGRDPYQYLDRYLTVAELAEVERLQHKTKGQVDRIINFIDDHGACDEELRGLVYQAFGIGKS